MFGFFKSFFGHSVNDSLLADDAAQAMDALDIQMAKAGRDDEARKMLATQFAGFSKQVVDELDRLEAVATEMKKVRSTRRRVA